MKKFTYFFNEQSDYTVTYDLSGEEEQCIAFLPTEFHAKTACNILNQIINATTSPQIRLDEVEKLLNMYAIELKEEYFNNEIYNRMLTPEKRNEIKLNINFRVQKMVDETRKAINYSLSDLPPASTDSGKEYCQCDQPQFHQGDTTTCARCGREFDPEIS